MDRSEAERVFHSMLKSLAEALPDGGGMMLVLTLPSNDGKTTSQVACSPPQSAALLLSYAVNRVMGTDKDAPTPRLVDVPKTPPPPPGRPGAPRFYNN